MEKEYERSRECVYLDESGTDGAKCSRKVESGRRAAGAIRSLVACIQKPRQPQLSPFPPILIFTSYITAFIYAFNSQRDMIHPYLSPL